MKRFFCWMQAQEGWKTMMALVYALICLFDFVIVPAWIGLTSINLLEHLEYVDMLALDGQAKLLIIQSFVESHEPFTLKGGGLFHLAFGALLTGSAISKNANKDPAE